MIKGAVCDEVLRMLSRYAYSKSELNFERRDVEFHINSALAEVVVMHFNGMYSLGEKGVVDAGFLSTYELDVKKDENRNAWYSDLPALPIAMENNLGLYEVSPIQDQSSTFFIQRPGATGLYSGLYAANMDGSALARQEGKKIFYTNVNTTSEDVKSVLVLMVADTYGLSMADDLPMPANYQGIVVESIFSKMASSLGMPIDRKIDGTNNAS